jgi:hypothetical protein
VIGIHGTPSSPKNPATPSKDAKNVVLFETLDECKHVRADLFETRRKVPADFARDVRRIKAALEHAKDRRPHSVQAKNPPVTKIEKNRAVLARRASNCLGDFQHRFVPGAQRVAHHPIQVGVNVAACGTEFQRSVFLFAEEEASAQTARQARDATAEQPTPQGATFASWR